jgi:hypothetical protein
MTIKQVERYAGVHVHLDSEECAMLVRLAKDASQITYNPGSPSYLSICVLLGQRIDAVLNALPDRLNR